MKHAFIIIFTILFSLEVDAETISSNQLVGTMWEDVDSEKPETDRINTISFDAETLTSQSYWPLVDITTKKQFDYYLTDYEPEHFDSTQVGSETSGYYLVTYCKQPKGISWYEILSCDLDTGDMYLLHRMRPGVIGGRDVTIHYKLIRRPN